MSRIALAAALALGAVALVPRTAEACGGCFIPTETTTVVTDHRMVFSISQDQSTLYDQIQYSGSPSEFAWVLPFSGPVDGITVGYSANILFTALDGLSQTQIRPPPTNCPVSNCPVPAAAGAASSSSGGPADDGVTVLKTEVVGPYQVAFLSATSAKALETWLGQNGYAIPADVAPVVTAYQDAGSNFLAVKLRPNQGVQDMRPIRVTTKGANIALPLRMVAAGTGPTVGITLWVLSDGRYEPANFPSFTITDSELVWNWAENKSNYTDLRAQKTAAANGKTWEVENSTIVYRQQVEQTVKNGSYPGPGVPYPQDDEGRAAIDYAATTTAPIETAVQVRDEDLDTLFYGIATATSRLTRLRADLAHQALDADLSLHAAPDQSVLSNIHQLTQSVGQPVCPNTSFCGSDTNGSSGTSGATNGTSTSGDAAAPASSAKTFACAATGGNDGDHGWMLAGAGLGAAAFAHAIRRRRARR